MKAERQFDRPNCLANALSDQLQQRYAQAIEAENKAAMLLANVNADAEYKKQLANEFAQMVKSHTLKKSMLFSVAFNTFLNSASAILTAAQKSNDVSLIKQSLVQLQKIIDDLKLIEKSAR